MKTHFADLAVMGIAFLLMWLSCLGWGCATARLLGFRFRRTERQFDFVWLGWAVTLLLLQVWHCFLPVDWQTSLVFVGLGVAFGARRFFRTLIAAARRFDWRIALFILVALLAAGWIASRGMLALFEYDSGGYHFNMIRWISRFPVVPGLANLSIMLGCNQTFFLQDALWDIYPFFNLGYKVATTFLFLVLLLECLYALMMRVETRTAPAWRRTAEGFLPALLLPVVALMIVTCNISSPSPDTPSLVLQFVVFLRLFRLLARGADSLDAASSVGLILILSASMATVKLSNAAFGLLAAAVAIWAWSQRRRFNRSLLRKPCVAGAAIAGAMLALWLVRGVIWSGYPFFPTTFLGVNVPWAAPVESVRAFGRSVLLAGRMVSDATPPGTFGWVKPWLGAMSERPDIMFPLITLLAAVLATLACLAFGSRAYRAAVRPLAAAIIAPGGAVLFWFFTAPAPRFGVALLWLTCIGFVLLLARAAMDRPARARFRWLAALFLAVNLWPLAWVSSRPVIEGHAWMGFYPFPATELRKATSRWGVEVYVPAEGFQCWDAPLPSTPRLDPDLALRGKDLGSGFVIRKGGAP